MQENTKMASVADPAMLRLARYLFRPLARLFLRRGLNYHELRTILAWSLVQAALNDPEFAIKGRRVYRHSVSHAAAMTGMTRREAAQYAAMEEPDVAPISERTRRAMRVMSAWRSEPGYQDEAGLPLVLPLRGAAPSFEALAEAERRDVPPRAIADLLVAEGNAEWLGRSLRLLSSVHRSDDIDSKGQEILAEIATNFVRSVDSAFSGQPFLRPRFRQAVFDDVPMDKLEELREAMHSRLEVFNSDMNLLIGRYRDRQRLSRGTVGIISCSFFEAHQEDSD